MGSSDWPWSEKEKREYLWASLVEAAQSWGENDFAYTLHTVKNEGEYDPVFLSRAEQKTLIFDFVAEGKIKIIKEPDPKTAEKAHRYTWHLELLDTNQQRPSAYSHQIQSLADLLKDVVLRNRVRDILIRYFDVYDVREIKSSNATTTDVLEDQDELLLLMEELGFVKIDWNSLSSQTHRVIGNRYMRVKFFGEMAKQFADALYGRTASIRPKALEQIATLIKDLMSYDALNDFFIQVGVPHSLLLDGQQSKYDTAYNVLLTLASTGEKSDTDLLYRILGEIAHPLFFQGDEKAAADFQYKVTKVIRYDGLSLFGGEITAFEFSAATRIENLEREEEEVSANLMKTLPDLFGGNPFAHSKPSPQEPEKTQDKKTHESVRELHLHINNHNQQIQSSNPQDLEQDHEREASRGIAPQLAWSQIRLKFDNGHDVTIWCDKERRQSNYIEMGFEDSKKRSPNTQWSILKHMAENERFISFNDAEQYTKDLKSQKKQLSERLQQFFGILEEPFEFIKSESGSGYLAIFDLQPEQDIRKSYLGDIE